jgi:TetR/AcrR family transcriptional regulator
MTATILDAAQRIFEQYGARRANVEDVARAAGVSRSTLYRAYPNKDALLDAVLVRQFDAFLAELDRVRGRLHDAAGLPGRTAPGRHLSRIHH